MKKRNQFIITCFCLLTLVVLTACQKEQTSYENEQKKFAQEYKVKIEDYPYPAVFPVYYFIDNLKAGDSIEAVHNLIQKYDKVYHCQEYAELYYFWGSDDSALKFMVFYDENIRYEEILTEDKNSGYLEAFGCVAEGIIK